MSIHECAGEKSFSIFGIQLNQACLCDHEDVSHNSDNCCSDKEIIVKSSDIDKNLKKDILLKKINLDVPFLQTILVFRNEPLHTQVEFPIFETEFPPSHTPPLYILFGVFRI